MENLGQFQSRLRADPKNKLSLLIGLSFSSFVFLEYLNISKLQI